MAPPDILIVGCGIAGPTLASFLLLADIPTAQKPHITILERSSRQYAHLRGQNIDIRGAGVTLMRKLGLESMVRSSLTGEEGVQIVDEHNYVWSSSRVDKTGRTQTPTSDIEILRGRLAEICWMGSKRVSDQNGRQGGKEVEYMFGDYLEEIDQDGAKVHVRLAKSGERRSYDLVIGADGLQSRTRTMVWGEEGEEGRINRLDMYAGFFSIPRGATDDNWRRWFHAPGRRGIMLRPDGKGLRTTVFMYVVNENDSRLPEVAGQNINRKAQKALLEEYFSGAGWECDRIIQGMHFTDDFYYDMVAQVKMDRWSKGRVVLLGDAGYCASPLSGLGTTLGFLGAYNLAGSLKDFLSGDCSDPSIAFAEYETKMRPVVQRAQKLAPGMPRLINPETARGIWTMRHFVRILSWTRVFFKAVMFLAQVLNIGIHVANTVPIEDYGFIDMPNWEADPTEE